MIRSVLGFAVIAALGMKSFAADSTPPPEAFRVLTPAPSMGPRITPYLAYETESAWREDDNRRKAWEGVSEEHDLFRLQDEIRGKLLAMIGGLPAQRTPLHPQITGRIQMHGYHIEKLIFESLPGVYVTALVYVPDDKKKHPGILVPCGHAANGKVHYQVLCQRLVQRGYVVICWDPVGQGERSQFWDAKAGKSRYNLICAEHAVLGNLAYLAGTNLARWEIWDGVRATDYLITRPEVDSERINITGTSGGGFQAAHLAALDKRIKVAALSCYITALPMRVYNRIFADPDSDPEQDLFGMISNHVDNPGLLLLMYPRPVLVAAGVLDFFPIEGTRKTVREVTALYNRFGHGDDVSMVEGYHAHQFSDENQEAALDFLDRYNQMPRTPGLPPFTELEEKKLQCTKTGQTMLDFSDATSLMDSIREYYLEHKQNAPGPAATLKQLYYDEHYAGVRTWEIGKYSGAATCKGQISWESRGSTTFDGFSIDRYLLRHSRNLEMPLLHIHKVGDRPQRALLWFNGGGKAAAEDWNRIKELLNGGYDIVSFDFRGLGETRMPYKAISEDDPELGKLDFDHAYVNQISGVLPDYVYNSLLTGRPYFLQMIEDAEIAARFSLLQLHAREFSVAGADDASTLASSIHEVLPEIELLPQIQAPVIKWSEIVEQKREIWPIQYLLPGGAYIH
jgi:pimeloyl-ACP methyl ester carboxylesterase